MHGSHAGAASLVAERGLQGMWAQSLQLAGSRAEAPVIAAHGLLACGIWDLSSQTSDQTWVPESTGGFLTTGPPGKSLDLHLRQISLAA